MDNRKDKIKKFIITIDTEGDNLWAWNEGDEITTKNVMYLERFQELCNQYGFKPVWLSNWEMINDPQFVQFVKKNREENKCEVGMHIHAWNNPPIVNLKGDNKSGAPYLIEYSLDVMREKIEEYLKLYKKTFDCIPVSHRAGRWAMNKDYFMLLEKNGIQVDCSYTPGINWSESYGKTPGFKGPNYSKVKKEAHYVEGVYEIPVSIEKTHKPFWPQKATPRNILKMIYYCIRGKVIWLRPDGNNLRELYWLVDKVKKKDDYLMFMLHSSEFMPGGSPTFKNEHSIDDLFQQLEELFLYISKSYEGITLEDYYKEKMTVKGKIER